jgi:hypothetical protein
MTTLETITLINSVVSLLTEAYDGPPNPSETWFIDNDPNSGILGILDGISASEASFSVDGSEQSGSTIAANAEHLRWSLANANAALRGETYQQNWRESWNLLHADEAEWERLRRALRGEFEALRQTIKQQTELQGEYLTGVLALIPHAAYHLGTIRQMTARVRANPKRSEKSSRADVNEPRHARESDLPGGLAQPARRALIGAGCLRLEQVAALSEAEVKQLHGIGPNAINQLRRALAEKGLSFTGEKNGKGK